MPSACPDQTAAGWSGSCARPGRAGRGPAGRLVRLLAVPAAVTLLAACHSGGSSAQPTTPVTVTAAPSAPSSPSASSPAVPASLPPGMFAVTAAGALVVLNPATGAVARTLVPAGVTGDEISVSPDGSTVYFASGHSCASQIESVPAAGGTAVKIAAGTVPAVSPDGTRLAFAADSCAPTQIPSLVVRTLSSGHDRKYPMVPSGQYDGLASLISHLSWAPDSQRLAVSISSPEDNEGWDLMIVDTPAASYYLTGAGVTAVPVTGEPNARDSYLREGVFMPDGNLFVSRACCAGIPIRNTSRLMWEVSTSGAEIHQVAIGFATLDHVSLDASADGQWLLYLGGGTLYVSHDGATPHQLSTSLIAAAWQ